MKTDTTLHAGRVIGCDAHPDSFTNALVEGSTPANAIVLQTCNKVPMSRLESWARKHTTQEDVFVVEASGNSFDVVRRLRKINRKAEVVESFQMGKLKDAHANNDKISAIRIAKAYLAGTAKKVWVPDEKTQERRDWFHAHRKAVKETTRTRSRLRSYLSDHGVRLPKGTRLAKGEAVAKQIQSLAAWTDRQWQVIEVLIEDLQHADQQRAKWRSLIAQEVASDPLLLSLMRLCGVREIVAFALGAIIGDINRFADPKKLVKYIGLNPAFDDSGENQWKGGIGGHGRKDLRSLLIEAAHGVMRSQHPIAKWGRKLLARKSQLNLVIAAVARKLTVAIWYLMKGKWTSLEEIDHSLEIKIGKVLTSIGSAGFKLLGKKRQDLRQELFARLKNERAYCTPLTAQL